MLRNNIWIFVVIGMIACGSSNQIQISAPGVVSASVKINSLETSKVLAQKEMTSEQVDFSGTELGLEAIEIDVSNGMKSIVTEGAERERINVNAITTLAACRFKKSEQDYSISDLVVAQNKLLAKQFLIVDLHLVHPNMNLTEIQELNQASIYGLLIKGFERLAEVKNVSIEKMLEVLCLDVEFDGLFNSIDQEGDIHDRFNWYDDQLLKSTYADAIYAYASEEIETFDQLPVGALVNEISLSAQPELFSSLTVNYSFDH